ncbi:MAG TPA: hypothetical protein VNQ73_01255 [Ilumatobacter sp.]|nr:hypothetical protein [Ilumatobacter sp.]
MTTRVAVRWSSAVVIAVAAGIGAACSSSDDDTGLPATTVVSDASPSTTTQIASHPTQTAPTSSPPPPGENDPGASADAVLLAMVYTSMQVGTQQELVIAFGTSVAEAEVAACMTSAGFQYVENPDNDPETMAASNPANSMPADEYARRYGFGFAASELGLLPPAEVPNPNRPYYDALSQGQRDAYNQTYANCRVSPERQARSNALNVALDTFRDTLAADDQVVAAVAEWQRCMSASGFDYETPRAMREALIVPAYTQRARADLERVHTEEVTVAVANVPCEAAYKATYREVVTDRFDEFRTLHESALATGAAPEGHG